MIIASVNNESVRLPNKWSEITYTQAKECYAIDLPEIEDTFDWFKYMSVVKKVFTILTGFTSTDSIDPASLVHFFSKYLAPFVYDLKSPQPSTYMPKMIESFSHRGVVYLMPNSLDLGVNVVLQHSQTVKPFVEASNLLAQFSSLRKDGFEALPMFVASIVKQDRLEQWDEEEIARRASDFSDLPMDVIWEVFFCTSQLIIKYASNTLQSMAEKPKGVKGLIRKLDLKRGRLRLRRQELQEQLKASTR